MERKVKGIYINVVSGKYEVIEEVDELENWYELLGCENIDIVERKIGGKYFDFICDDEGVFQENPVPTALDSCGKPLMVGSLFICNHDSEGELQSLSDEDINFIKKFINVWVITSNMRGDVAIKKQAVVTIGY